MTRPTRKLTTILAADVVGFSKLMDQHEELTLKNLKTCRDIVDPIITEYGGRIFHTAGDSVIAAFARPVSSVEPQSSSSISSRTETRMSLRNPRSPFGWESTSTM